MSAVLHHGRSDRVSHFLKRPRLTRLPVVALMLAIGVSVGMVGTIASANGADPPRGAMSQAAPPLAKDTPVAPPACTFEHPCGTTAPRTPKQIAGIVGDDGSIIAGSGFLITHHSITSKTQSQYFGHFTVSFPSGTWSAASLPVPVVTKFGSFGNISIASINNSSVTSGLPKVSDDGSFSFRVNLSEPMQFPPGPAPAFSFTVLQT